MSTLLTEEIFDELHRGYERRLTAIAFSYVRDWDTAKDIVADSFMTLWERREKLDESKNIKAYLVQTVINNALRYRRDENTERLVFQKILKKEREFMEIYTKAIECCNPDELFCNEISSIYKTEIERMPELRRKMVLAHKTDGKTYKEIADSFGVDVKRVDNELHEAATKLRHALKDYVTILILMTYPLS